jgi:GT2 family glycosyltransferase
MSISKTQERLRSHATGGVSESPLVAISILNWNRWRDTLECLESVRRLDYPNYLTVVVDNGSWDGSADRIKAWAEANLGPGSVLADYTRERAMAGGVPETEQALDRAACPARMVLIRNEENLGFTGGNNVCIHYALHRASTAADYVLLLNNDARIDAQCVTRLASVSGKAGAGIVGAVVTNSKGEPYFAGSRSYLYHLFRSLVPSAEAPRDVEFWDSPIAYGAAMLVSRQTLEAIYRRRAEYLKKGLFAYADEIDFCWLAHREGFRIVIANGALARHDPAQRLGPKPEPRFFFYYSTRNIILVAKDFLPLPMRFVFHAAYLPLCIRRIAKRLINRQPGLAGAIACGLIDGIRGTTGKWKRHDEMVRRYAAR